MSEIYPYDPATAQKMLAEGALVEAAIREAVHEALVRHKRLGLPVVSWQDGKVVWIPADQIPVDVPSPAIQ